MQHPFPYEVIYSDRKSLAIQITAQATVRVRVPKNCPAPTIDTFLYEKQAWILKHLDSASQRLEQSSEKPQISENDRKRYIQLALDIFYTQDRILCPYHGRHLRPYLHPGTENPLGKLLQRRKFKL